MPIDQTRLKMTLNGIQISQDSMRWNGRNHHFASMDENGNHAIGSSHHCLYSHTFSFTVGLYTCPYSSRLLHLHWCNRMIGKQFASPGLGVDKVFPSVAGLPGKPFKPFLTFSLEAKTFFPSFCGKPFLAFFLSVVFKIAPKCPFHSLYW